MNGTQLLLAAVGNSNNVPLARSPQEPDQPGGYSDRHTMSAAKPACSQNRPPAPIRGQAGCSGPPASVPGRQPDQQPPAYATIDAVIPVANQNQLLGLLVGTNVGPIVTPWASLATLLRYERCRAAGMQLSWWAFAAAGVVTAVVVLAAATGALVATG